MESFEDKIINFEHPQEDGKGFAYVKTDGQTVQLTLSLEKNGDVEVALNEKDCANLIDALKSVGLFVKTRKNI